VVTVDPSWVVLGAVSLGALLGLFQLPAWQLCVLAGIILGRVSTAWGQSLAMRWTNKLWMLVRFALRGGLATDDPGAVLAAVREMSPLIATRQGRSRLSLALFGFWVIAMYLFGRWRWRVRPTVFGPLLVYPVPRLHRLIAGTLGAINGYLMARFLIPLLFPETEAVIKVPRAQLTYLLNEKMDMVVIGLVLVLILLGLQASGRGQS